MFAYCGNNPVNNVDPTGKALDTVWDIISFGQSLAEVVVNPADPIAWFSLAADTACLIIPGLTGGGSMVRVAVRADRLADAAKYADKIVDAKRAISSSLENGRKIHKTYMSLFEAEDVFVNRSLGKIYDEVSSRLRPDAVDTANRIMYELKPYNKESFVRALNQVESYLTTIGDNTSEWTIIIDMYS